MVDKIAIMGDFNPIHPTLHALNDSTRHIQKYLNKEIQFDWIATDIFDTSVVFRKEKYKGLWVAPGSPYRNMENVLDVIQYARNNNIPTFGNCGGFQHMIIEFAKNACGIDEADHEETNPDSPHLLVKKMTCSLKGVEENLEIIDKTSIIHTALAREKLIGKYYCSYGVNEQYIALLEEKGITFTSQSEDGNYRSFEIKSHPFFVGTLFQPALSSSEEQPDPIIIAFIRRAVSQ